MFDRSFVGSRTATLFARVSTGGLLVLLTSCTQKTSVQLASENISPGWKVQIVQVSEPDEAMVLRKQSGIPASGVPEPPSDKNRKWLAVKLSITAPPAQPIPTPSAESTGVTTGTQPTIGSESSPPPLVRPSLKFTNIQLAASGGEAYSAEAISSGKMWKRNDGTEVLEFLDPTVQATLKDSSNQVVMKCESGRVYFFRSDPQDVIFLFSVPKRASQLSFRL